MVGHHSSIKIMSRVEKRQLLVRHSSKMLLFPEWRSFLPRQALIYVCRLGAFFQGQAVLVALAESFVSVRAEDADSRRGENINLILQVRICVFRLGGVRSMRFCGMCLSTRRQPFPFRDLVM